MQSIIVNEGRQCQIMLISAQSDRCQ